MTAPGKLIAVEGIDGSGKRTQVERLTLALKARGYSIYSTGFPQYESWFGKMVGQFLNGDLGSLENVDPHFTALLYAGDRFEAKPKLEAALNNGQIVLVDRYVGSNLAHQTARVTGKARRVHELDRTPRIWNLRAPARGSYPLFARGSERSAKACRPEIQEKLHRCEAGYSGSQSAPPRAGRGHVRPPRAQSPVGNHRMF